MRRTVAIIWHASFSVIAGALYFYFVLPRWWELTDAIPHTTGTVLRIVTAVVIALAALPVVFTLLRTRNPEEGTPQLALTLRICSIVAHVLAGVLIAGAAISEIWLSLDAAGRWLFGIYGAAAAIALLGVAAFYLSFVAALPPAPPKPPKPKKTPRKLRKAKTTKRRTVNRRRRRDEVDDDTETDEADDDTETGEVEEASESDEEAGADSGEETEAEQTTAVAAATESAEVSEAPASEAAASKAEEAGDGGPAASEESGDDITTQAAVRPEKSSPARKASPVWPPNQDAEAAESADETEEASAGALRNRRPTGKAHRHRRSRSTTKRG